MKFFQRRERIEPAKMSSEGEDGETKPPNVVKIKPEALLGLVERGRSAEAQKILNKMFSESRRNEMIGRASDDIEGHKVVYFRTMSWPILLKLLTTGQSLASDYYQDYEAEVDQVELLQFLNDYAKFSGREQSGSVTEALGVLFPGVEEVNVLQTNPSFKNVVGFAHKYIDKKFMLHVHSGGNLQKFSAFLSAHVGGIGMMSDVLNENYFKQRAVVEMVIPDEFVTPNAESNEGEKEVLLPGININWISRVHSSPKQFEQEVIGNPNTSLGNYSFKHQNEFDRPIEAIDRWKWDVKTNDCLPVDLLQQDSS